MLILGARYKFTSFDLEKLEKKFNKIRLVTFEDKNTCESGIASQCIEEALKEDTSSIVVVNTDIQIDNQIFNSFKNIRFIPVEHFLEEFLYKCYIPDDNTDVHYFDNLKGFTKFQMFQKRAIDFFGVFWLFIFSFFVMQKCKRKIGEESPGDIYFRQKRIGLNDKEFECIKFRSMHENCEFFNHYTQENDPRIFPWGEHMRKRRYDELPQMLNILKGEMHLIGPRTEWNELVKKYEEEIPYYSLRHMVAPGITGWAQVMYPYGSSVEDAKQKLMYDLYYIKHWNILLELKIVWMTAMVVVDKKGV